MQKEKIKMKTKGKELNREQIDALFYAVNEKNITGKEIIEEIEPLIKEFYHGNVEISGDCLIIKFLNGQVFRLSANAI